MDLLVAILGAAGFPIFLFGLQTFLMAPLTLAHGLWKRRFLGKFGGRTLPAVSVIVPAYNEERTIAACVASILASEYADFEVIVVDDGSSDTTAACVAALGHGDRVTLVRKRNGGKAGALNAGIARARGEVLFCTDADVLFRPDTLRTAARWFADPSVAAVCGNDTPLEPRGALRKLLAVTTHVGTGFVRRALSLLGVLPVISGNSCAVRREVMDALGGFTDVWGEDFDLTVRLHRAGAKIVYDSDSLVLCESPGTLRALWRQRVRWTRSFLKITALHRDLLFRVRYFPFSWYLPLNWFNLIGIPLLQLLLLPVALIAWWQGDFRVMGVMEAAAYAGFGSFLLVAAYSILLDGAPGHLLYLVTCGWLIVPLCCFYDCVVAGSLWAELRGAAEHWAKAERRSDLMSRAARPFPAGSLAGYAVPLAVALLLGAALIARGPDRPPPALTGGDRPAIVIATHYDAWTNPPDAIRSVLARDHAEYVTDVAVGAGRWEWNFFRWEGHEETWSNDQRRSHSDLLADAVRTLGRDGRRVIAIVDFYAPAYLRGHPSDAARDEGGKASDEQVCFDELVEGRYGTLLREMVSYIARTYDVEGISLTELAYGRYCYDERCLDSYRRETGRADWPRRFLGGRIDRHDPSIGAWRSRLMTSFLRALADTAHAYGKKLFVDVPVDYGRLAAEGMESGLHTPELVSFVDGIVVWDYFSLEGRSPATSEDVARFFVGRYGSEKVVISLGLWGEDPATGPLALGEALTFALRGGARKIWITPNHLLTPDHWRSITSALGAR